MAKQPNDEESRKKGGVSKTALLVGAAGLFLFIVGVKRRYRLDEEREIGAPEQQLRRTRPDADRRGEDAAD